MWVVEIELPETSLLLPRIHIIASWDQKPELRKKTYISEVGDEVLTVSQTTSPGPNSKGIVLTLWCLSCKTIIHTKKRLVVEEKQRPE